MTAYIMRGLQKQFTSLRLRNLGPLQSQGKGPANEVVWLGLASHLRFENS